MKKTRLINKEKVDYKIDEKYYRRWKLELSLGKNLLLPQEDTRLDTRILDAFKQNPLTQSLTSAP